MLISVGFLGSSIVRPPCTVAVAEGEGGEVGGKAACLFKGTEGLVSGREWRLKGGGGGSRAAAQQYQPSSTEEAPQTLGGGRGFPPPTGIIIPISSSQSRDLLIAAFHHRMSCGNISSVRLDQECLTSKCPNHQLPSLPMQAAPSASSALQRREPGRRSLPLTRTARLLQPGSQS